MKIIKKFILIISFNFIILFKLNFCFFKFKLLFIPFKKYHYINLFNLKFFHLSNSFILKFYIIIFILIFIIFIINCQKNYND